MRVRNFLRTDSDGCLIGNVEFYGEDDNADRNGFYAILEAMRRLESKESSLYGVAGDLGASPCESQSVFKDETKRRRYTDGETDNERVQQVLHELDGLRIY